jgi:gamma-glutamylcyclotransferase (GGCT)/AIG2-like uncharacterized protein YtfP
MTTMSFFMIGSWTEGMFHFQKIKSNVVSITPGQISARVYRLPIGFPVLVEDRSDLAYLVDGQILEISVNETLIALLDSFHGVHPTDSSKSLFLRKLIDGKNVYMINPAKLPKAAVEISGSCWKKSLSEAPPLPMMLTEKQKEIVRQLGNIKGRDVVLVKDLSLYRDLMKMELIVDKGRRLALSPLGKDVFQYLS